MLLMLLAGNLRAQPTIWPWNTVPWFNGGCYVPTVASQSQTAIGPGAESWKPVFQDEFAGTTLDRTKWETKFNNPVPSDRTRPQEGPVVFYNQNVTVGNRNCKPSICWPCRARLD